MYLTYINSQQFTLPFPQWVTKQVYLLIQRYLKTKDVAFLDHYVNQCDIVVKVLRTADYLGMVRFHDRYINQILIPNINHRNCITFIEESHKKLKNINDSQTWYNLLNMSIIYLSTHAYKIFEQNPPKFKKLNQKIVTEVLERVIRLERKNNFENKHKLYQLILECKECKEGQAGNIAKMFEIMRVGLKAKKIHSKIHAKLSWKLQNIPQLSQKNTKNFKYLDMNWYLRANKTEQGLQVTLNLLPYSDPQPLHHSQSQLSENTSKSSKSFQISKVQDQGISCLPVDQPYKNDSFTKIGIFYSKLHWKVNQQAYQQELGIHYILMTQPSTMKIFLIDPKIQSLIGHQKVQLTIYCNTETIYTFLINYVLWHADTVGPNTITSTNTNSTNGHCKMKIGCVEELEVLVRASKGIGNFGQALVWTAEIFQKGGAKKGRVDLAQGYDFSKMNKQQLNLYTSLFNKKPDLTTFPKPLQPSQPTPTLTPTPPSLLTPTPPSTTGPPIPKRTISPIPITPISSINKRNNFSSNSNSQIGGKTIQNNHSSISNSNYSNKSSNIGNNIDNSSSGGGGGSSIFQTPSGLDSYQKKGNFNKSQGRDGHAISQSLANSRGDSRGKRKIFSGSENGDNDKRDDLMTEMFRVTDLSRFLNSNTAVNPEYEKLYSLLKF